MKKYLITIFVLWVILNAVPVKAEIISIENTDFVSAPSNFNRFKNIDSTAKLASKTSNSKSKIDFIGTTSESTADTPYIDGQGRYGRYENEGGISNTQSLHLSR